MPSGRIRSLRHRRRHPGTRRQRERGRRDLLRRFERDVPAMRVRGIDVRPVRSERIVDGPRECGGLVARNVDFRRMEQHEIGDVGAQMDRIGPQPESAPSLRAAVDECRERRDRPIGARGRCRVPERTEYERFERAVPGRGRRRGAPGPREEPVESVEVEPVEERLRRIRISGSGAGRAEQPGHEQDHLHGCCASHRARITERGKRPSRARQARAAVSRRDAPSVCMSRCPRRPAAPRCAQPPRSSAARARDG